MSIKLKIFFPVLFILSLYCSSAESKDMPFLVQGSGIDMNNWYISNGWANGDWQSCEWRRDAISVMDKNLQLKLSDKGGKIRPIGCAEIHTNKLSGYGSYEARMRVAKGSGLNTAFFTYVGPPTGSKQHDEIDFEFLGKDTTTVQLNYYVNGQGNHGKIIKLGYDASKEFHNYKFEWNPNKIRWYIDDKLVYETPMNEIIPANPGHIYFSLWSGVPANEDWLGPFKYQAPVAAEVVWTKYTPLQ
jgi:endo-1,3-1,4-beta-glycanase ExoK